MRSFLTLAWLSLALGACAILSGTQDQVHQLTSGPLPTSVQDRASACQSIHGLQARMHDVLADRVSGVESPFSAATAHHDAAQALGALDTREQALACATLPPLASTAAPATTPGSNAAQAASLPAAVPAPVPAVVPAAVRPLSSSDDFDRCFQRCRSYTERSKEQCFDVCNR